jgi:hypothetical protein
MTTTTATTCDRCDRVAITTRGTRATIAAGNGIPLCGYHAECCDHCHRRTNELYRNLGEMLCDPCLDESLRQDRRDPVTGWIPGERIPSGPFAGQVYGGTVTPRRAP